MNKRSVRRCLFVIGGVMPALLLLGGCHSSDDSQKPTKSQMDALRADPSKMPPEARKAMEASQRRGGPATGGR